MKARKRGSKEPFEEVEYVQLKDSYVITKADQMEFENETTGGTKYLPNYSYDHWQDVRERAAITAMQGILSSPIIPGVNPNPSKREIADLAVLLADELVKRLKGE